MQSPVDAVTGGTSPIRDVDLLLQDMDINRLRAVVFRDIVSSTVIYLHAAGNVDNTAQVVFKCHSVNISYRCVILN